MSKQKTKRSDDEPNIEPEAKRPRLEDTQCSFLDYDVICDKKSFLSLYGRPYCHVHYGIIRINILPWSIPKNLAEFKCLYVNAINLCQEMPYGVVNNKFTYCRKHLSMVLSNSCDRHPDTSVTPPSMVLPQMPPQIPPQIPPQMPPQMRQGPLSHEQMVQAINNLPSSALSPPPGQSKNS